MSFRIARAKAVCGQQDSDVLSRGPGPKPHLHGREGGRPFNRKIYIYCVYIYVIYVYIHMVYIAAEAGNGTYLIGCFPSLLPLPGQ